MNEQELATLLLEGNFKALFLRMGWEDPGELEPVRVEDSDLVPVAVGDKRGVTAWLVECPGDIPQRSEQHRVVRRLRRFSRDQLIVFVSQGRHLWLWPEQRPSGVGYHLADYEYASAAPTEALLQRLARASFAVDEENDLTATSVLARIRRSFNADRVTKSFYREFQKHHKDFVAEVEGIPTVGNRRWYVSVLLNRLMFIYFIQQKRFLDGDQNYLQNRLRSVREQFGEDQFYAYYREFLLPLFHEGLGSPSTDYSGAEAGGLIGDVPYVNGGIFEPHRLEKTHQIEIPDNAFESLFDFFDDWRWHLDERPTGASNEINPDILGFIFEQYINYTEAGQKEKGAYYTKPDVTGYMAASTILPALADRFVAADLEEPSILLSDSGDTYIHDSILHGVDKPLPEDWDSADAALREELALPGERLCDVVHRRERCTRLRHVLGDRDHTWTIDDAVTENLDLRELMADYLSQLSDADECDRAFGVLRSLTVCDPTVGSGAFLFAALEVLGPLYETVLGRAAELSGRNVSGDVAQCLVEVSQHHSARYWMLKTLCLNNLHGVDLMEEAPEIAKLRLFLKLAAQIDDKRHVEPLPDLDFNIKTGNLLVGIADADDAQTRLSGGELDFGGNISEIAAVAVRVRLAYEEFTDAQEQDTGALDHRSTKQSLSTLLESARGLADTLLHAQRPDAPKPDFEDWKSSHQAFHWFVEFPSVWQRGGFDVMLGNPPYVKASEVPDYELVGYRTQGCPDLYAPCVERTSNLINDDGRMSMIVMHSLCFGRNYATLRSHLEHRFPTMWVSSYSRIPDGLFSGSARVRNSILVAARRSGLGFYTASCRRWISEYRPSLFDSVEFAKPPGSLLKLNRKGVWPFVDSQLLANAFGRMASSKKTLSDIAVKHSEHSLAYKRVAQYMLGVSESPPPTRGGPTTQRYGYLYFGTAEERDIALLALAGRWGYLWWYIFSDEFHVTRGTLAAFPGDIKRLVRSGDGGNPAAGDMKLESLLALSRLLQEEMPKHLAWKLNAGVQVGRYNMHECRHITDEADLLLAELWGIEDAFDAAGSVRDRSIFGNRE